MFFIGTNVFKFADWPKFISSGWENVNKETQIYANSNPCPPSLQQFIWKSVKDNRLEAHKTLQIMPKVG